MTFISNTKLTTTTADTAIVTETTTAVRWDNRLGCQTPMFEIS